MICYACKGLSREPPSVHVVLPSVNDDALVVPCEAMICQTCAREIAEHVELLRDDEWIDPDADDEEEDDGA